MEVVFLSISTKDFFDFKIYTEPFAMFWFDTLNLTNGICFLKLFE